MGSAAAAMLPGRPGARGDSTPIGGSDDSGAGTSPPPPIFKWQTDPERGSRSVAIRGLKQGATVRGVPGVGRPECYGASCADPPMPRGAVRWTVIYLGELIAAWLGLQPDRSIGAGRLSIGEASDVSRRSHCLGVAD